MKTITTIGVAIALCMPALAAAQRGGGAGAVSVPRVNVQRVDVRRVDTRPTLTPGRDNIARGFTVIDTGTRIRRPDPDRRLHNARRRWNAAHPGPNPHARRRWNAAHPSDPDPAPRRADR